MLTFKPVIKIDVPSTGTFHMPAEFRTTSANTSVELSFENRTVWARKDTLALISNIIQSNGSTLTLSSLVKELVNQPEKEGELFVDVCKKFLSPLEVAPLVAPIF